MRFTKMQGLGNDYIYLDATREVRRAPPRAGPCGSPTGTSAWGATGSSVSVASERADFRMRMFNADGSEGEMCGNGIRCVGKFVYDKALTDKTSSHRGDPGGYQEAWSSMCRTARWTR